MTGSFLLLHMRIVFCNNLTMPQVCMQPYVAAYNSSYNPHQYGLYTQLNSWVVVRTI